MQCLGPRLSIKPPAMGFGGGCFIQCSLGDKGCETLPSEGVSVHVSAAVKVGRKWKVLRRCLCAPRNNIFISKMLGLFE